MKKATEYKSQHFVSFNKREVSSCALLGLDYIVLQLLYHTCLCACQVSRPLVLSLVLIVHVDDFIPLL